MTKKDVVIDIAFVAGHLTKNWYERLGEIPNLPPKQDVIGHITLDFYLAFEQTYQVGYINSYEWQEVFETFAVGNFTELIDLWAYKYLEEHYDLRGVGELWNSQPSKN